MLRSNAVDELTEECDKNGSFEDRLSDGINDRFGHKCGDKALRRLGDVLGQHCTAGVACRVGGRG